jgi:hypothetical protein
MTTPISVGITVTSRFTIVTNIAYQLRQETGRTRSVAHALAVMISRQALTSVR